MTGGVRAVKVKDLDAPRGTRVLWLVGHGEGDAHYVLTSAIPAAFDTGQPETYVFACDAEGNVTSYTDLEGSFQGGIDHELAIAGYVGAGAA